MSLLHIFDMDGTLLRGTTASLELGRRMGCLDKVQEYERAAAHGEIDNRRFHEVCQALWVNTTIADLCAAFEAAPWMLGLRELMEDITARGEFSAVISMSPSFWVERLLLWGVGSTYATEVSLGSPMVDHAKVLTHRSKLRDSYAGYGGYTHWVLRSASRTAIPDRTTNYLANCHLLSPSMETHSSRKKPAHPIGAGIYGSLTRLAAIC